MNLLHDPVFTVDTPGGRAACSLPRVYSLLLADEVEGFSRLQSHQKQAWHCFLAQLGAIATEDQDTLPKSEEGWREALSSLAGEAAWNLYTADLRKPAFMQPPLPPDETLDDYDPIHVTEYDVPTLSKNHALKTRRMHDPDEEHWAYMLVNVQTTGFYAGSGNRRTSRMNGSYASRPFFGLTPSLRLGPWITRDVNVLRAHTDKIERRYDFQREVTPLLWTEAWDGTSSFDLEELHPLYIDCSRRIRKGETWMKTSTSAERVTGDVNGQTGDPWAPVDTKENKVLNPSQNAFEYRQLSDILFGERYRRPISFEEETKGYVVCRAVTGEQGGRVHNLQRVAKFSNRRRAWDTVEQEAERRVKKAEAAAEILSHALYLMFKDEEEDDGGGSGEQIPDRLQEAQNRQLSAFHERVDACFFQRLFDAPDVSEHHRSAFWETILVGALQSQFEEAKRLCPDKNRWERQARAQSAFDGRIKSEFTYAKQNASDHEHAGKQTGVGKPDARAVAGV